jgi:hypothetical protein
MRAVRALARGKQVEFRYLSEGSKKCKYCTLRNEMCRPVPLFVGREYEELDAALVRGFAAEAAEEEREEDLEESTAEVCSVALRLATMVQVATAQVKNLNALDLLLAAHY